MSRLFQELADISRNPPPGCSAGPLNDDSKYPLDRFNFGNVVILNLTVITLLSRSFVLVLENQPFRTHSIQRITCSGWMILEFISLV
jgi:hypothetical protein